MFDNVQTAPDVRKEAAVTALVTRPTRPPNRRSWLFALTAAAAVFAFACGSTAPTTPPPGSAGAPSSAPTIAAPSVGSGPSASPAPASQGAGPSVGPSASIDPANFVGTIDNPWFPLIPGTVLTYRGIKDGEIADETFTVTKQTKVVAGVTCVVVHDELKLGGDLAETTDDWYVQDRDGNVWYFGEATQELEGGKVVNTEGSWEGGVDGAEPGIYMPAHPAIGQSAIQEFYADQAEDHFVVLLTNTKVKVPLGSFSDVLLTAEWTPLEPDVLSEKFYVKGTGEVREVDVAGGDEKLELTKVARP
jgi:hypothetical protein